LGDSGYAAEADLQVDSAFLHQGSLDFSCDGRSSPSRNRLLRKPFAEFCDSSAHPHTRVWNDCLLERQSTSRPGVAFVHIRHAVLITIFLSRLRADPLQLVACCGAVSEACLILPDSLSGLSCPSECRCVNYTVFVTFVFIQPLWGVVVKRVTGCNTYFAAFSYYLRLGWG